MNAIRVSRKANLREIVLKDVMAEEAEAREVVRKKRLSSVRILLLGTLLVAFTALGFYFLPGMIDEKATGSHLVNAFYCAVMTLTTIGFGDICPASNLSPLGKLFIVLTSFCGLGMFCGPVMALASVWSANVPGGMLALTSLTIAAGVVIFTSIEGITESDAAYMCVIAGTTIGFGDVTPSSNIGKIAMALYSVLVVNVVSGLLQPARVFLESLCLDEADPGDETTKSKKEE